MPSTPLFRERLAVPWWAWPAGVAAALFVGVELTVGAPTLRVPAFYAAPVVLVLVGLLLLSRIRIRVTDDDAAGVRLRVDDANLPVSVIAGVSVVDAEQRRRMLGVDAEPLAFVILRPWISGGVRIDLSDPQDPTPYWFVSSRRPAELAGVLEAARVRT